MRHTQACYTPQLSAVLSAIALLLAALLQPWPAGQGAWAQDLPNPLAGHLALDPSIKSLTVTLDTFLERILNINVKDSTYSAVWWVVLEWNDPDAYFKVLNSTTAAAAGGVCSKPCDSSGNPEAGCCDTLWLPGIDMPNFLAQLSDLIPRYRITISPAGNNSSDPAAQQPVTVRWSARVSGTWYSPFDFRAYPFEHQHLMLQLQVADVLSSRVGLELRHWAKLNATAHTKGADYVGWDITQMHGEVYDSRKCQKQLGASLPAFTFAAPITAPSAGNNSNNSNGSGGTAAALQLLDVIPTTITPVSRFYPNNSRAKWKQPATCGTLPFSAEWEAMYGPQVIVLSVMVRRAISYYVLGYLVPLLIIPLITMVVFAFPQDALADRMGVVVTMFLSLTAMQFVFDYPPSRYLNSLQQTSLMVYALLLIAALESLLVAKIVAMADQRHTKRSAALRYSHLVSTVRRTSTSVRPPSGSLSIAAPFSSVQSLAAAASGYYGGGAAGGSSTSGAGGGGANIIAGGIPVGPDGSALGVAALRASLRRQRSLKAAWAAAAVAAAEAEAADGEAGSGGSGGVSPHLQKRGRKTAAAATATVRKQGSMGRSSAHSINRAAAAAAAAGASDGANKTATTAATVADASSGDGGSGGSRIISGSSVGGGSRALRGGGGGVGVGGMSVKNLRWSDSGAIDSKLEPSPSTVVPTPPGTMESITGGAGAAGGALGLVAPPLATTASSTTPATTSSASASGAPSADVTDSGYGGSSGGGAPLLPCPPSVGPPSLLGATSPAHMLPAPPPSASAYPEVASAGSGLMHGATTSSASASTLDSAVCGPAGAAGGGSAGVVVAATASSAGEGQQQQQQHTKLQRSPGVMAHGSHHHRQHHSSPSSPQRDRDHDGAALAAEEGLIMPTATCAIAAAGGGLAALPPTATESSVSAIQPATDASHHHQQPQQPQPQHESLTSPFKLASKQQLQQPEQQQQQQFYSQPSTYSLQAVNEAAAEGARGCGACSPQGTCAACYAWLISGPTTFVRLCKEDAEFAKYMARAIDRVAAVTCFVCFGVAVGVMLYLQTQLGMHKMLLGQSRPGNM